MRLIEYKKNIHSENGEDGVIQELFRRLGSVLSETKWCVEFGAWDGRYASNTFNLVKAGWHSVYIEGDETRYLDLLDTAAEYSRITPLCAFVSHDKTSEDNLDSLLKGTSIPSDFDLLSIDIDSFDLEVWNAFTGRPKVVVIEINSSVKPGIIQWHDGKNFFGNSFSATLMCARNKGYVLVCHTGNMIFVREDLSKLVNMDEMDLLYPESLFISDWISESQPGSVLFKLGKFLFPQNLKNWIKKHFLMKRDQLG